MPPWKTWKKLGKKEGQKKIRMHRFAFQTRSYVDILDDGYRWRKYGRKAVKNNKFPIKFRFSVFSKMCMCIRCILMRFDPQKYRSNMKTYVKSSDTIVDSKGSRTLTRCS